MGHSLIHRVLTFYSGDELGAFVRKRRVVHRDSEEGR